MKLAAVIVLASTTVAYADVDWARGLVTAEGIGVANRAAPSPAAARGPARRMAEDAARKKLAAQLPALAVAAGGTIAKTGTKLEGVVARAIVVAAEPETDGSWRVTMAVPIEAVRQAIGGGARAASDDDKVTPVVVVEGATVKPAVGYTVGGIASATVFVKTVPAWAESAPRVKAKGAKAGGIEIAAPAAGVGEGTLFVVVTK